MNEIFYFSLVILLYTFFGYPILLELVSLLVQKNTKKKEYFPTVSIVIAAFNEEKFISQKIKNTLAIKYPKESLEIIIFSDGSTDGTDSIVNSFAAEGVQLLRIEERKGKTHCQNRAIELAKGEIIVFSDANSMYDENAITELVANFSDPEVGVVCGELRYAKEGMIEEGQYWKFEKGLKKKESLIDSCLGANGAMYAVKKELYVPLPDDAQSDFIEPFMVYKKGFRVIYEEKAFCIEEAGTSSDEFNRKRRIILRALQGMRLIRDFLNPFKFGWYSLSLWSHKVIRWISPIFMIIVFLFSPLIFFYPQVVFYVFAIIGKSSSKKIFAIPYYIVVIQLASLLAVWDFIFGKKIIVWNARSK